MVKMDIITPVTEPTEWVNQLILVHKPNGKLRICLDPRDLNKSIKRHHYKLATAEELFAEMSGAKFFTKLDASSGYWQIKIDEESSKLLTFATPEGRYGFLRLSFGIHSASELFQAAVADVIKGIPSVIHSQDDILIFAKSQADLHALTTKVLSAIRKSGMKLNKEKCVFNSTKLVFLGHQLPSNDISPDPAKVKAINDMSPPENRNELKTFLGMVAYLAKFIPHLSDVSAPLRQLLDQNMLWDFSKPCNDAFLKIKDLISTFSSLRFSLILISP